MIAEVNSVSTRYSHTDGLGSPVAQTETTGAVASRTRYETYGHVAAGPAKTIGFTGHVNDIDTGLTYMQQRYYDPIAGRMLSIDPVITDANTGGSFNRYAYANNSPYKYTDPDGRNPAVLGRTFQVSYEVATVFGAGELGSMIGLGLHDLIHETANPLQSKRRDDPSSAGRAGERRDSKRDNNRNSDGEKPAPDKTGKDMGKQIGKDFGDDAQKEFHNMKEKGAPDRTIDQLKQDGASFYKDSDKTLPDIFKK